MADLAKMPDTPVEAVEMLTRLAAKAKKEGLHSLREDAEHADNQMLREGLQQVLMGHSEADVKAALGRQTTEARANGVGDLTVMRMVETGILSIQAGEDSDTVRQKLEALLTPEEQARLTRRNA